MIDFTLFYVFGLISIIALMVVLYPFRRSLLTMMLLVPVVLCSIIMAYCLWGGWGDWKAFVQNSEKKKQVEALLKSDHGAQIVIEKIKERLKHQPKSTRGWYLLGRLYASQEQWQLAEEAYFKAYQLKPQDQQIIVNYAQSLWRLNNQKFNKKIRDLFQSVLTTDPNQPDALAMLAMDAYNSRNYKVAIEYWQRLLSRLPPESGDAKTIRSAIEKAQIKGSD